MNEKVKRFQTVNFKIFEIPIQTENLYYTFKFYRWIHLKSFVETLGCNFTAYDQGTLFCKLCSP